LEERDDDIDEARSRDVELTLRFSALALCGDRAVSAAALAATASVGSGGSAGGEAAASESTSAATSGALPTDDVSLLRRESEMTMAGGSTGGTSPDDASFDGDRPWTAAMRAEPMLMPRARGTMCAARGLLVGSDTACEADLSGVKGREFTQ
jgi:hypothetical protein